jgi:hypothetical protein
MKNETMAALKIGSSTYIMPLDNAVKIMQLMVDVDIRVYKKLDNEYQNIIVPMSTLSDWDGALELRVLKPMDHVKEKVLGEKWMEQEAKSA